MLHAARYTALLLLMSALGCGYDSTSPGAYDPPSPPPPPSAQLNEGLWTSSGSSPAILHLAPQQLLTSGKRAAATTITTTSANLFTLNTIAFASDGTMWVASRDDSLLVAFTPAALNASGERTATTVISSNTGSLSAPMGLAFDRQHRLWVANAANGTIVRFDSAQLATSGTPTPAVIISGVAHPIGIAFDAAGALWVSDNQVNTITRYTEGQLASSGSPTPAAILYSPGSALVNPSGIAFDAAGNLWVAGTGSQSVVAYTQAQQATTGAPMPAVVLSSTLGSLSIPAGLAFDGDGSLWVMGATGVLEKFTRADLSATGAPRPSVDLQLDGHVLFWSLAFWPRPAGLPLH